MSNETPRSAERSNVTVTRAPFGVLSSGETVYVFTIANADGVAVRVLDYGGLIVSIETLDRHGAIDDIVLGFDQLRDYEVNGPYFGALVGRYANRIANGAFTLDGARYTLAANNGAHALHGGVVGFHKRMWNAELTHDATSAGVALTYTSPDGEEGYPGALTIRVSYALSAQNALSVKYHATTDRATPVNLTQHSYFNLAGHAAGDLSGHTIEINADTFTPVDATLIPTGELQSVAGTPFDLRRAVAIGAHIDDAHEQLRVAGGYDHNFVIARSGPGLVHAARVVDLVSGRSLDVATTEPGIQLYTGNFLDGSVTGKAGHRYARRGGVCLETQHFPDSPNQPTFPSSILRPGQVYASQTVYTFGVVRP